MKKFKNNSVATGLVVLFILGLAGLAVALAPTPTTVNLGRASNFAILAGSGITNSTGPTTITGDVGSSATPTETGFSTVTITGTNHIVADPNDAATQNAKIDLTSAYNDARDRATPSVNAILASDTDSFSGVGYTLLPGIYKSPSSIGITGTLTLNGGGNPNAVFIFQAPASTLTTAIGSVVALTNGAQACNVFWQVGTSATLDQSTFSGTIMADQSITDTGSSTIIGRFLARIAHVTLSKTTITVPTCVPSLLLQKAVAGGGPDDPSAWTLKADGALGSPTNLSGITDATGANSDLQFPNATFKADTYTLSETGPTTNYVATYSCVNVNNGVTTTTTSSSITLVAGDKATCTITNTYTAPVTTTLKLVKAVTNNNGGTALNTAWTLTATGAGGFSDNGGTGIFHTVTASVGYVLSESTVAGYTAGNWSCDGGSLSGSTITLSSGQNVICTIINDDNPTHLIVIKHVVNDSGTGSSLASAFSTTISEVTTATPTATGVESPGVTNTLTSIGAYSVDEGAHTGYTKILSDGCSGTIALGETKTCTITNDDIPPSVATLTVTKTVINTGGGTKVVANFPLLVGVTSVTSGVANSFAPGSYAVTETTNSSYLQTFSGSCDGTGHITLVVSQDYACTITNTFIPSYTLHVFKQVVNTGGGTAIPSDFSLHVKLLGTDVSGSPKPGDSSGTSYTLLSNTIYVVSEVTNASYTQSFSGDCNSSGSVTLDADGKTCTITNTYIPPVHSSGGGTSVIYGCKDPLATNYNYFAASNPSLCIYDPTITAPVVATTTTMITTTTTTTPALPSTGLPPRSRTPWDIFITAGILMVVSSSLVLALKKRIV